MENKFIHDCSKCDQKCDGISKKSYIFLNDVEYSEAKENLVIDKINSVGGYQAKKCELEGYPDIEILHLESNKKFYIEIKAQRRTFMAVKRKLPFAELEPSETIACNLSDLERYIKIHNETKEKIFVVWCLENRPCIVEDGKTMFFYQEIDILADILKRYGDKRRFRRESGYGDVVNGQHKGVVVNYHFSLNEFLKMHLLEILKKGIK